LVELVGPLMKPDGELPGQLPDFQIFKSEMRSPKTQSVGRTAHGAKRLPPAA
jgi:hypothetical protein